MTALRTYASFRRFLCSAIPISSKGGKDYSEKVALSLAFNLWPLRVVTRFALTSFRTTVLNDSMYITIFIPEFILSFLSLKARIKYIIDLITVSIIVNRNKIEIQLFLLFWNHE